MRVPTMLRSRVRLPALLVALVLVVLPMAACTDDSSSAASSGTETGTATGTGDEDTAEADYPNVLEAELSGEDGTYALSVTMSSQYDTPERYADGWRVLDGEGNELGEMTLGHDHASEQPFTRSQSGLEIPDDVEEITVEGRDLENGYGGATVTVPVPS